MDVQHEVDFFDKFQAEYGDYDVLGEGAYRRLLSLFRDLVAPRPGETAIDLGCGTGAFTRRLADAFNLRLTGMDISPRSIARAKESARGERYVVGDITDTRLPSDSFDLIVYSGVLHHCNQRALRLRMLEEGLRILRPGGRLFSYDPSWHSPSMRLYRDPSSPFYSDRGRTQNEVLLKRDELMTDILTAGFTSPRVRGVAGITFDYVAGAVARALLPVYNLYERVLRFSPFEDRWGTFLVGFARKDGTPTPQHIPGAHAGRGKPDDIR